MPRVNIPQGSIWKEFDLDTELITPTKINLKLRPSFKKEYLLQLFDNIKTAKEKIKKGEITKDQAVGFLKTSAEYAKDHVVGWNLTDGKNAPVICTTKIKNEEFYDALFWEDVKTEKEKTKGIKVNWLWTKILEIISDIKNFVKN